MNQSRARVSSDAPPPSPCTCPAASTGKQHLSSTCPAASTGKLHLQQVNCTCPAPVLPLQQVNCTCPAASTGKLHLSSTCPAPVLPLQQVNCTCPAASTGKLHLSSTCPAASTGKQHLSSTCPTPSTGKLHLSSTCPATSTAPVLPLQQVNCNCPTPSTGKLHLSSTCPATSTGKQHLSYRFNRFQYSYKIGYRPNLSVRNLFKRMRSRVKFRLSPRNSLWEPLSSSDSFTLGRPMFFEAQAEFLSPGQRLYVHSCFATPDPSPSSTPQFTVVNNYGCMVESKDGRSSFIAHRNDVVRFSVDAFVFHRFEGNLFMHCSMSVGPDTPTVTDKSCNYHPQTRRWVELYGSDDVCSCCDSHCGPAASTETVISSSAWNINVKPEGGGRRNKPKFSSRLSKRKPKPSVARTFNPETTLEEREVRGEIRPAEHSIRSFRPEEIQPVPETVRWAVKEEKPLEMVGSADVEELEEEEGTHKIFEEIFDLALHNYYHGEINS
ncbi:hypothetical protein WMY93_025575 [Mugilogobius chulae]|uniref:ZP domain-containing protein n=1 Tax=Mugilogobius chulae TaxID=88201 RepID=A0AAW0MWS1_9GOBI